MNERPSKFFLFLLWLSKAFRRPYLWAKRKWPGFFIERVIPTLNLNSSRMLRDFNFLHRLFFGRGFETIRFDMAELKPLKAAMQAGPVVYLMRNWGQVEYNYFNDLFLQKDLPLVVHNNLVKMGHWMPSPVFWPLIFNKWDRCYETGRWPYNSELLDLTQELNDRRPVLFCLNLPRGTHWMEESAAEQIEIFQALQESQGQLDKPIQLVPLHFIYDKHPGRENSLTDILFGERENPGYFRKMILFLRNYKKRAVAKIGAPIDFHSFLTTHAGIPEDRLVNHWVSVTQRAFDSEARQVTGPKLKNRKDLIADILEDPKLRQKVRAWGDTHGQGFEAAEKKTKGFLWEIASDIRFSLIELLNYFFHWFVNTVYSGIQVDEEGIFKVKQVAKDSPLILAPCHKSHIDYLLLSYVFYHRDLSLPIICAGNNLNFWPLGPIFRRSGAYFIRRSFAGDELYSLALKGFVGELLREGYFQEFFVEGTRSRSGKLFPPKTGIIRMILETFLEENLKDAFFVPVSLAYDRVLEEKSYLKERKGGKKQKEKFTDLFRLPRFLRRRFGKIYLQIGEPISVQSLLKANPELTPENRASLGGAAMELARDILCRINSVTTLLPAGLTATVLLSQARRSFTFEEVQHRYDELLQLARSGKARLSENLALHPDFSLEEVLEQFVKEGLIGAHQDGEERFFTLREDVRPHLDYFKNTAIHFYAPLALAKICRDAASRPGGQGPEELWPEICSLLSREFFFAEAKPPGNKVPDWFPRILFPILEAYWLVLKALDRTLLEKVDEKTLIRKILEVGETLHLRGTVLFPESLSQFTTQNAVHVLLERGILRNMTTEMGDAGRKVYTQGPEFSKKKQLEEMLERLLDR